MTDLNLKDWRARHGGISQKQLSMRSGYCESILSRYECGVSKPSRRFLLALAALAHGLNVDDVYGPKEGGIGSVGKHRTEELLSLVLKNAVDIKFGLQTYAFELRKAGKVDEANRLLGVGNDINRLFYEVMAEMHEAV